MLRAQSGERLFKSISIRVFHPGNKRSARQLYRAPSGQGISAHGIDTILKRTADQIEQTWPAEEYSLIELAPAAFNFTWRRHRNVFEETLSDAR